jgi:hypothetical protein
MVVGGYENLWDAVVQLGNCRNLQRLIIPHPTYV